eukprot:364439-Chlamydomonas_euryale.AAC.13
MEHCNTHPHTHTHSTPPAPTLPPTHTNACHYFAGRQPQTDWRNVALAVDCWRGHLQTRTAKGRAAVAPPSAHLPPTLASSEHAPANSSTITTTTHHCRQPLQRAPLPPTTAVITIAAPCSNGQCLPACAS